MASISEILVVFTGSDGGLIASTEKSKAAIASVGDTSSGVMSKLKQIGTLAVTAMAAGVVAGAAASIKAASDFQKQLTMIHTQANQAGADLNSIGSQLLTMAGQVGASATTLAEVYYHFASAGMDVKTSIDATRQAAELAKVGNSDYESTAQAVVAVLSAYPQYAGNAAQATSILNAIVGTGDMRMQQLAKAMSTGLLPAFATAKLTITDAGAALATITDNATPADEAATRLRMTVALLQHQSGPASDALGSIGIKAGQLGEDMTKPNGLLVAITDLRDHLAKTFGPEAIAQTNQYVSIMENQGVDAANKYAASVHGAAEVISVAFGGGRTSAAIQTLLGEYDKFKSKYPAIIDGAKNFQTAWEETKNTFSFQMDAMKAGMDALAIKIGQALLPMAGRFMSWMTDNVFPMLQRFADWFVKTGVPDLERFGTWIQTQVFPVLQALAGIALMVVVPAFHALVDVVEFVQQHFAVFLPIIVGLTAAFVAYKTAMMIQGVIDNVSKAWEKLVAKAMGQTTATTTATGATQALTTAVEELAVVLDQIASVVTDIAVQFDALGASAGEASVGVDALAASETAADVAATPLAAVLGVILSPLVLIAAAIGAVVAIGYVLVTHWKQVKQIAGDVWGAIKGWFEEFASYISSTFMGAVHAVGNFFVGNWQRVKEWVGRALNDIGGFFEALPGRAKTAIDDVVRFFLKMPDRVMYGIGFLIGRLARFIHDLPGNVADAFEYTYEQMFRFGRFIVTKIADGLTRAFHAVVDFFVALPGNAKSAGESAISAIYNFGKEVITKVKDGIVDSAEAVWAWFKSIPGELASLAGQLWSGFLNFGKAIINGVVAGIKAAPGAIWDALKSAAGGLGSFLGNVVGGITGAASSVAEGAQAGYNAPSRQLGGPIYRTGLYQLHAGEYVLNPQQTSSMLNLRARIDAGPGPGGTSIGAVNVYNPTSNVDVMTAISQQQWLARMAQRGVVPQQWPATVGAA